jgi:hypothetical protein
MPGARKPNEASREWTVYRLSLCLFRVVSSPLSHLIFVTLCVIHNAWGGWLLFDMNAPDVRCVRCTDDILSSWGDWISVWLIQLNKNALTKCITSSNWHENPDPGPHRMRELHWIADGINWFMVIPVLHPPSITSNHIQSGHGPLPGRFGLSSQSPLPLVITGQTTTSGGPAVFSEIREIREFMENFPTPLKTH